jgi:class I fructose-bisphosphate aldolase
MVTTATTRSKTIQEFLGPRVDYLLQFSTPQISRERLHLPGPDIVGRIYSAFDRNNWVLISLERIFHHGRLGGTGYLSILRMDQGSNIQPGRVSPKTPTTSIPRTS